MDGLKNEQIMIKCHRTLLSYKKEQNTVICTKIDGTRRTLSKMNQKQKYHISMWKLQKKYLLNRLAVA